MLGLDPQTLSQVSPKKKKNKTFAEQVQILAPTLTPEPKLGLNLNALHKFSNQLPPLPQAMPTTYTGSNVLKTQDHIPYEIHVNANPADVANGDIDDVPANIATPNNKFFF